MVKLIDIKPLAGYQLWLRYEDGTEGITSLAHLKGKGVFSVWEAQHPFETAYIDADSGAIAWSEEVDICPDSLYFKIRNIIPEEFFKQQQPYAANQ